MEWPFRLDALLVFIFTNGWTKSLSTYGIWFSSVLCLLFMGTFVVQQLVASWLCDFLFWFAPSASLAPNASRKLNGLSCTWVCVCTRVVGVVNTSLRGGPAPSRTVRAYCLSHVSAACVCVTPFLFPHNTLLRVLNYSLCLHPLPLWFLLIFSMEWRYLL